MIAKLHAEIARALKLPEIRNSIVETGAEVGGNSPEEFASMIRADQERWKKAAMAAGIAPE